MTRIKSVFGKSARADNRNKNSPSNETLSVTIVPATHRANAIYAPEPYRCKQGYDLLPEKCKQECKQLFQCGIEDKDLQKSNFYQAQAENGFVYSVIDAYNSHHHLEIRPEDVWLAILTQLSAYVNAHAEELRGKFVSHQGRKQLVLSYDTNRHAFDFGIFADDMSHLLQKNVVDPELREWLMPSFSTTTRHDVVVASIVMMATLQSYFKYHCEMTCGLPSVTLLGDKSDWEKILMKLDKLKTYGEEPTIFANLLRPIISRFVRSFDDPKSPEIIDFWQRIVHTNSMGSGDDYYTGWLTAFCYWDYDGRPKNISHAHWKKPIELDGVVYPAVDVPDIPPGWARVPVTLDDNGEFFQCTMVAGSVGKQYTSSGKELEGGGTGLDTIRPQSCWWIFETNEKRGKLSYLIGDDMGENSQSNGHRESNSIERINSVRIETDGSKKLEQPDQDKIDQQRDPVVQSDLIGVQIDCSGLDIPEDFGFGVD